MVEPVEQLNLLEDVGPILRIRVHLEDGRESRRLVMRLVDVGKEAGSQRLQRKVVYAIQVAHGQLQRLT